MIRRHLTEKLREVATYYPVVTLTGPRQSGKTVLVRSVFPDHQYVSLERPDRRAQAIEDPLGFLASIGPRAILDEVQRAPDLLSYIQVAVDEDARPGRFILTGSQNLLLMERVTQSLAGRTAVLRLLPLSVAELLGRLPLDPDRLEESPAEAAPPDIDRWDLVWSGLFPRVHADGVPPDRWYADYYRTYVERDLREVLKVMDVDAFEHFVRLTAARTGQEVNLSELAADAGITQPTARQWLTALRIGFLVMLLPPHHANFRKRLRKRPRLHFLDSGLVCHLLQIRDAATLRHHPLRGPIFESFVVSELAKAFEHAGRDPPLFFWRDATGHEIDVVMDLGTRLVPVEIKAAETVTADAASVMRWWNDLPGNASRGGVLVHGGTRSFVQHGIRVRPWYLG